MKPRMFIGSASEARTLVDALETELRDEALIERWDRDVFRPGRFTLEELMLAVKQMDFAIFVLGRDDVTESRGSSVASPRDNVIFESGLFTAMLGRERTFYVVDKAGTKIPSDWAGLGCMTFDDEQTRPRDKVYDAVRTIRQQLSTWQPDRHLSPFSRIIGFWWQFVVAVEVGTVLSLMEIAVTDDKTLTLHGSSWGVDSTLQERYHSQCARYDAAARTLHYAWEGDHPREQRIPRYFGVGEITFRAGADETPSTAEGWFSSSRTSDVKDAFAKATIYARATSEEVDVFRGTDHDNRVALIKTKLSDRAKFDT